MYDKNHYNIVISLKLIKINGETKQNKKQSGYAILHFYQQWMRIPFAPHS